jgi:hypothetical protein
LPRECRSEQFFNNGDSILMPWVFGRFHNI